MSHVLNNETQTKLKKVIKMTTTNKLTYGDVKQTLLDADFLTSDTGRTFFESGTYHLSHGEYSAPDYTIVKKGGEWVVRQYRFFYPGTLNATEIRYGRIVDGGFQPNF